MDNMTIIHVNSDETVEGLQPLVEQEQKDEEESKYISQKDFDQKYDILQNIGQGAYGSVVQAFDQETDEIVAIKLIQLQDEENIDSVMREVKMMKNISENQVQKCQNIINYIDSFIITDSNTLAIVMEYAGAGSIKDLMKGNNRPLTESEAAEVMYQLLNALQYLHQNKIIHRDIKAANVLVTEEGVVKLADLGVSRQLSNTLQKRNTVIGTSYHMAPEIFLNSKNGYDNRVDIWSLGITLIEILQMKPPNSNIHPLRLPATVSKKPPRLDGERSMCTGKPFSEDTCSFVAACLQPDPDQRATLDYLQQHPFLKIRHSLQNLINHQITSSIAEIDPTKSSIDIEKVMNQAQQDLNTIIQNKDLKQDDQNTVIRQNDQLNISQEHINDQTVVQQDIQNIQEQNQQEDQKQQAQSKKQKKQCCVM